jgi:5-oxoprolinase (ATP-hydrolysing) subunit A
VKWCKQYKVVLGAHPGFPDLLGFGRRVMGITPEEARDYIIYQVGALKNFADYEGVKIRTAKPHGAFYLWAIEKEERCKAVLEGLLSIGGSLEALHLPALPDTFLHQEAKKAGLRVVNEIYPGLVYGDEGGVGVKRKYEGDPDEEAELIRNWLVTGQIVAQSGKKMDFDAESIEVHGDMTNAPEIIRAISETVKGLGVEIGPILKA